MAYVLGFLSSTSLALGETMSRAVVWRGSWVEELRPLANSHMNDLETRSSCLVNPQVTAAPPDT